MRTEVFILLQRNIKAKTGLEEAVVNQATVWPESGADRAAANRENPVLFSTPNQYNPNLFPIGDRFGLFAFFYRYASIYFRNGVSASQPPSRDAPANSEARAIPERSAGCISFPGHPLRGFIVLSRSVNESTISFIPSYSVSCSASTGFVCIRYLLFIPSYRVYIVASAPKVAVSVFVLQICVPIKYH